MGIVDYLLIALIGICVVFLALIFLMIIIKIMTWAGKKNTETGDEDTQKTIITPATDEKSDTDSSDACANEPVSAELAPGSAGDILLYDTDPKDAAMCMAIVANTLNKPINELRFISIREVNQ